MSSARLLPRLLLLLVFHIATKTVSPIRVDARGALHCTLRDQWRYKVIVYESDLEHALGHTVAEIEGESFERTLFYGKDVEFPHADDRNGELVFRAKVEHTCTVTGEMHTKQLWYQYEVPKGFTLEHVLVHTEILP